MGEDHAGDYDSWSKEQLVARITALEAKIQMTSNTPAPSSHRLPQKRKRKEPRKFDFSLHACRPIALKVAYLGWNYHGLASQGIDTDNATGDPDEFGTVETVEGVLLKALMKARLIPGMKECGWSRCGRTDKGVSSFSQIVGLHVRSGLGLGAAGTTTWEKLAASMKIDGQKDESKDAMQVEDTMPDEREELSYLTILNGILPADIRVLAWSPVSPTFNARFDCLYRRYQYIMPAMDLNITNMQDAAQRLIGEHDFRYFCKIDSSNPVRSYSRRILSTDVRMLDPTKSDSDPSQFIVFEVKGTAFLWNQVRCMTAILQLIGRGLEPPSIITDMLDMSKHPAGSGRPIYPIASELPLVLMDSGYPDGTFTWRSDGIAPKLGESLWCLWRDHAIKSKQVDLLLGIVAEELLGAGARELFRAAQYGIWAEVSCEGGNGPEGVKGRRDHVPIMERKRCESIETRITRHLAKTVKGGVGEGEGGDGVQRPEKKVKADKEASH
ncbi:tRNA pseudouridine synthase 3 [Dinochytrium kinnereticum]|nr:tRNA pseudouridine synthase 3 [Dinochytrium kinnereticum]